MNEVVANAAQDVGIALLLGGNFFGRRAMHPALEWVTSPAERGKVTNEAWRRYGVFNSIGLAGVVGGWAVERGTDSTIRPQDLAVAAVAITGIASAIEGVRFGRAAPGGAVPMRSGSEPSAETPPPAARTKRLLNALGQASAVAELAFIVSRRL
jgi:hypothetical protein